MAFLKTLGVNLLLHGVDCRCCPGEDSLSKTERLRITTDSVFPEDANSPDTSVGKFTFGANSFTSEEVIIAKGYFLQIAKEVPEIWNLFLYRVNGQHLRVAQIGVVNGFNFLKPPKLKQGIVEFMHGIHKLKPDAENEYDTDFYLISRAQI